MRDPDEGVGPDGTIVTGVRRDRVPAAFEPVVHASVAEVGAVDSRVQLYSSLEDVERVLDGTVARVVRAFTGTIGLWSGDR